MTFIRSVRRGRWINKQQGLPKVYEKKTNNSTEIYFKHITVKIVFSNIIHITIK